jgi:hypothetical protein
MWNSLQDELREIVWLATIVGGLLLGVGVSVVRCFSTSASATQG